MADVFQLRTQLENDLLDAQSKIEDLEKLVQGQGTVRRWRHLSQLEKNQGYCTPC